MMKPIFRTYEVAGGNVWFDTATGTITDCDDGVTEANIPSSIDGVAVKEIGTKAFQYHYNLQKVTFPETITRIRYQAFDGCYNLGAVVIPGSVQHIAEEIFARSTVPHVTFLNGITTIPGYTFYDCKNLGSVTIPLSTTEIAGYAFDGCSDLTDIYYAGSEDTWVKIQIGYGNEILESTTIHYGSTGPENPGTILQPSIVLSAPSFGASVPLTVTGTGTRAVNFYTAFYNQNRRFVGVKSVQKAVYPGLQSVFVPVNQWAFVPTMKAFALDDDFRPLSPAAGNDAGNGEDMPEKYSDILSESDVSSRNALVDALTEQEAKDFVKRFAGWLH